MEQGGSGKRISEVLAEAGVSLLRYVRGQILIAAIMTVLYAVGFYFIGVPFWWLVALLCGPFHLVPLVGAVLSAVIPVAVLLISGHGFRPILFVLLLYGAIQLLETFFLTPKILGRELKLNPLVVFGAVLGGALIFGPVGALVAAPLVAILLLFYKRLVLSERKEEDRSGDAD